MSTSLPTQLEQDLNVTGTDILETNNVLPGITLTCGIPVDRVTIDSNGITLSAFTRFTNPSRENRAKHIRLINQHSIESYDDISLVTDRAEAIEKNTHTVWVMTDGDTTEYPHPLQGNKDSTGNKKIRLPTDVYTYERLPFQNKISTATQLETALNTVLSDFTGEELHITLD